MNIYQAINHYLTAGIDTGENLLLKRNIIIAVSLCTLTLLLEVMVITQIIFGFVSLDQLPKVLVSTAGVLLPFYLLMVKKNATLAILLLVGCTLVLELVMLLLYFDDEPYTHIMWAHSLTFPAVLLLGLKRSIIPMTLYSVVFSILVYRGIDNSVGSPWRTVEFHQFILMQILVLGFAFLSEWTVEKMLQKLQLAQKQERASAKAHAHFLEGILDKKKQLLADISHELRAPLAVIKADFEAVEDGITSQAESYPVIHQKLKQFDRLIEDIYLISQYDSQQLTLYNETITLSELGDELQRSFYPLANAKGLKMTLDKLLSIDCTIEGDRQRLIQVFGNFLQNSIHYTDGGGQIEVSSQQIASGVELTVSDSTPGVPEHEQQQLFERLYRVESSRNRATGGSGLGLAICKAIIEAHSGTINIASSPLGGLAITSYLPFTQIVNNAR